MLVKLNSNFLLFNNIWKRLKESRYLVISTLVHIFVVLLFLCPHFYFKKTSKFISNNNQIPIQILIQEKTTKTKKEIKVRKRTSLVAWLGLVLAVAGIVISLTR